MSIADFLATETSPVWPDRFPERLSPSSIALAASCPEKWRRKYVLRERDSWGGAALIGLAVHRALEINFEQKIETREDLPVADVVEQAAVAWDEKVDEAESTDGVDWGTVTRASGKDESVRLTHAYHTTTSPAVQPVAVEEWVGVDVPGMPPMVGRVDVRTKNGILDVKTTGRKMTEPRGDWRLKGMLYVLMTGQPVEWHVLTKTKVPAVYTPANEPGLVLPGSQLVMDQAARRVKSTVGTLVELWSSYGPDEAWPTNATEHDWACNYCGFRASCAHWAWTR